MYQIFLQVSAFFLCSLESLLSIFVYCDKMCRPTLCQNSMYVLFVWFQKIEELNPLSPEVISRQATINIGKLHLTEQLVHLAVLYVSHICCAAVIQVFFHIFITCKTRHQSGFVTNEVRKSDGPGYNSASHFVYLTHFENECDFINCLKCMLAFLPHLFFYNASSLPGVALALKFGFIIFDYSKITNTCAKTANFGPNFDSLSQYISGHFAEKGVIMYDHDPC